MGGKPDSLSPLGLAENTPAMLLHNLPLPGVIIGGMNAMLGAVPPLSVRPNATSALNSATYHFRPRDIG